MLLQKTLGDLHILHLESQFMHNSASAQAGQANKAALQQMPHLVRSLILSNLYKTTHIEPADSCMSCNMQAVE